MPAKSDSCNKAMQHYLSNEEALSAYNKLIAANILTIEGRVVSDDLSKINDIDFGQETNKLKIRILNFCVKLKQLQGKDCLDIRTKVAANAQHMIAGRIMHLIKAEFLSPAINSGIHALSNAITEKLQSAAKETKAGVKAEMAKHYQRVELQPEEDSTVSKKPAEKDDTPRGDSTPPDKEKKQVPRKGGGFNSKDSLSRPIPMIPDTEGVLYLKSLSEQISKPIYLYKDGKLERIVGAQHKGLPVMRLVYTQGGGWQRQDIPGYQVPRPLYDVVASEMPISGPMVGSYANECQRTKVHSPYAEYLNGGKAINSKSSKALPAQSDYSLLLAQKTNQDLVQLNKASLEYLKYFFDASNKKTQNAEEVKVYDVTRSPAQSSMFSQAYSELLGIPTVYASPTSTVAGSGAVVFGGVFSYGALGYAARGALALGEGVIAAGPAMLPVAGLVAATGLTYRVGQDYAGDVQRYSSLASSNSIPVKVTAADYVIANRMGAFDASNPYDRESIELIAKGVAIERVMNQQTSSSMWTAKTPAIDFKVMGRVDQQKYGGLVNPYFDIDPNAGRPQVLSTPVPHQPKSILFTPDDRASNLEWGKLPGFAPSMVKPWQESFPDQRELRDDLDMSVLYKKIDLDYGKLSKAFDSDVRYIHNKKYEGAKISDLDPNVVERMSGLIITDTSGKILGIHNTQDHHIIHQATEGAKELFDQLGLDIHGKENRITLPADEKLTQHGITDMTQHVGRHDKDILLEIKVEVDRIEKPLNRGEISKEKAKERLLNYIQEQRQGLETGKTTLNSVGRK